MSLEVSIQSVTRLGQMGIQVTGAGSPDGASIGVQIQLNGGGSGTGATQVVNGNWTDTVPIQSSPGQSGTATATAGSPQFPGQTAQAQKEFTC
jgi:hypothetical protein